MRFMKRFHRTALPAIVAAALLIGCDNRGGGDSSTGGSDATGAAPAEVTDRPRAAATQPIIPVTQIADWCPEHGVPESVCTRCNESLVAGFKAKGDWDEQHGLPKSQCFECDPSLKQKFAAAYKEKYGKEPPAVGGEHGGH